MTSLMTNLHLYHLLSRSLRIQKVFQINSKFIHSVVYTDGHLVYYSSMTKSTNKSPQYSNNDHLGAPRFGGEHSRPRNEIKEKIGKMSGKTSLSAKTGSFSGAGARLGAPRRGG